MDETAPIGSVHKSREHWANFRLLRKRAVAISATALLFTPALNACLEEDVRRIADKYSNSESERGPDSEYELDCETQTQIELRPQGDEPFHTAQVDTPYGQLNFIMPTGELPTFTRAEINGKTEPHSPGDDGTYKIFNDELSYTIISDEDEPDRVLDLIRISCD